MSGTIFQSRLLIGAQDGTGPVFKEIEKKLADVSKVARNMSVLGGTGWTTMSRDMSVLGGKWKDVANSVGLVSMEVSRAERHVGMLGRTMQGLGGIARATGGIIATSLGIGAFTELEKAVKASAAYQGAHAHLKYAVNATPEELAFAEKSAIELPKKFTNQSAEGVVQTFSEMLATLQNRSEAIDLLESAISTKSALETEGKVIDPEDNRRMLKAAEIANRTRNPEEFDKFGEGIVRARQMEGNLVTSSDILQFAQNAGSAVRAMSDRFLLTIGPSLMGEQSGSKSGAAMQQIYKVMTGAALTHAPDAVAEMLNLGLLKKDDVLYNKQGNASGLKPGHSVKDAKLGMSDFDLWMKQDLIPAMVAKHYNDLQQKSAISRIFKGKIGPGEAEMMLTQMPLLEQHARNYAATGGRAAAEKVRENSPLKAMEDVSTALANAATALSGPAMQAFAPAAEAFAKAVNNFVPKIKMFAEDHPVATTAGIGLGATAAALAAWELTKKIGGAIIGRSLTSGAQALGTGVPAGAAAGSFGLLGPTATALGGAAAFFAVVDATATKIKRPEELYPVGSRPRLHDRFSNSLPQFARFASPRADASTLDIRFDRIAGKEENAHPSRIGPPFFARWAASSGVTPGLLAFGATHSQIPSTAVMPAPRGGGGDLAAALKPSQVVAKLDGQANINITLSMEAPPELLALIRGGVTATAEGDLKPNLGTSMPEAAPSSRSGRSR